MGRDGLWCGRDRISEVSLERAWLMLCLLLSQVYPRGMWEALCLPQQAETARESSRGYVDGDCACNCACSAEHTTSRWAGSVLWAHRVDRQSCVVKSLLCYLSVSLSSRETPCCVFCRCPHRHVHPGVELFLSTWLCVTQVCKSVNSWSFQSRSHWNPLHCTQQSGTLPRGG